MGIQTTVAQQNPAVLVKEITDQYARKNFQNMADYFGKQNQLLNFKFFELNLNGQQSGYTVSHGLGVMPRDILVSFVSGPGQVTFDLPKSDTQNLVLETTDSVYIRFFVGSYWGNVPTTNPGKMIVGGGSAGVSAQGLKIVSVQAAYTVLQSDDIVQCSNKAFQVTMPDVTSFPNKQVRLMKADTVLTNIITIAGTSSQKFLYLGTSYTTLTLNTQQESWLLVPTASGWLVLEHNTDTGLIAYSPTSNWVSNCSVKGLWMRRGQFLLGQGAIYVNGTPTISDSLNPWLSLPTGLSWDQNSLLGLAPSTSDLSVVGKGQTVISGSSGLFDLATYVNAFTKGLGFVFFGGLQTLTAFTGTQWPNNNGPTLTTPGTYTNGGYIGGNFEGPIAGWLP